jgi:hypothetical protein
MILYNVIASQQGHPRVVNPQPLTAEQAGSMVTEQMGRGVRCRLEGVARWV